MLRKVDILQHRHNFVMEKTESWNPSRLKINRQTTNLLFRTWLDEVKGRVRLHIEHFVRCF